MGERQRSYLNLDGGPEFRYSCVIVYYSPGDSSVVVLAPKREGKGLKPLLTLSSSTKNQVTRRNPDPKPIPVVSDPENLLRKSQGQYSSSKDKFPVVEVVPKIETKPIVQSSIVSFPSTISKLNLEQWKLFYKLIEEEQTNTLSKAGSLRDFTRDTKSEPG
jgi:hypothetical protein